LLWVKENAERTPSLSHTEARFVGREVLADLLRSWWLRAAKGAALIAGGTCERPQLRQSGEENEAFWHSKILRTARSPPEGEARKIKNRNPKMEKLQKSKIGIFGFCPKDGTAKNP
jgi:hypothetical protein